MANSDNLNFRKIILGFSDQFSLGFEAAKNIDIPCAGGPAADVVPPPASMPFEMRFADARILNFPEQFEPGLDAAKAMPVCGPFSGIVICGMGGSALAGALLKMVLADVQMPEISIWRNYGLPANISKDHLVFTISYSGNTEETLSAYRQALDIGIKPIGISGGGKLEKMALENRTPFAKIPDPNIPPRTAIGYMFAMLVRIFVNAGLIPDPTEALLKTAKAVNMKKLENQGKALAKRVKGKLPLIYASARWEELVHNWKFNFNENSKVPAFYNVFPELHHNEMAMFEKIAGQKKYLKDFYAIILQDETDNKRVTDGIKIFSRFVKKQNVPLSVIPLKGISIFDKIFNNLILASWTSYNLATLRGIDPLKVEIVADFKKRMAK